MRSGSLEFRRPLLHPCDLYFDHVLAGPRLSKSSFRWARALRWSRGGSPSLGVLQRQRRQAGDSAAQACAWPTRRSGWPSRSAARSRRSASPLTAASPGPGRVQPASRAGGSPVVQCQAIFRGRNSKNASGATTRRSHCMAAAGLLDRGPVDLADDRDRRRVHDLVQFDEPIGVVGGERIVAQVGTGAARCPARSAPRRRHYRLLRLVHRLAQLLHELGVRARCAVPDAATQWSGRLRRG